MLSKTLQILIQRQNSEKIIQDCLSRSRHSYKRMGEDKDFVFLYRHDNPAFTLDQIRGVEKLLKTNWLKEKDSSPEYKYSKKDSLFNVVLRYAEDVLLLKDNQPTCRYEKVSSWHEMSMQLGEDLFTTALTASYDAKHGTTRKCFLWKPYITTFHPALDELYQKPLTELHAHLKGTSLNFDLNWLCLMNFTQNRAEEFKKFEVRQHPQVTVGMDDYVTDLYHQVMKAAAIRAYLFATIKGRGDDIGATLMEILGTCNRLEATSIIPRLQDSINSYRQVYGKRYYRKHTGYDIVDYAIDRSGVNQKSDLMVSVLCGERSLLYALLKKCYEGNLSFLHEKLLMAYLIIKARFRQEMIQLNKGVGFDNFATYEDRKTAFIKDGTVYEKLVAQLAVGNFLKEMPDKRYMEARIVPKEKAVEVLKQIQNTDADVHNPQFGDAEGWRYYYIYHFIKGVDKTKPLLKDLVPKHHDLREKVKRQAKAIYGYRNYNLIENNFRVVGVDAANSEINARPEVFAQAYRYLRHHTINDNVVNRPNDLRMTYHVGEDFLDIADGLRAYDEVVRFLRFGDGDRLGHALVLGVDVETYYKRRNHIIAMPIQMILDNTVWLYEECKTFGDPFLLMPRLEKDYENCFRAVFGNRMQVSNMHTYYRSWLLRGDNPFCYQMPHEKPEPVFSVDEWEIHHLVTGDPEIENARNDEEARVLYSRYHFYRSVKENGDRAVEYKVGESYVRTLELIREKKLQDAEKRHLAIECNPTSNYKIGELADFAEHPITKFYNEKIGGEKDKHRISVSINTDDAGVFATSIEREYAVMARTLEDKCCKEGKLTPKQVYDWLDDIRLFGQQQRFVKESF